jgi:putative PEP-CTERM system TPR-repeat lipoprotein
LRNRSYFILFLILLICGCSNQGLSKKDYYEKGIDFLKGGNPNGAVIAFKKAVEKDMNYFEARFQLALAYIGLNKYEKAEKELLKVLRLNPSFEEAHLHLAKIYVNTARNDEAIKEITEYIKDRDDNPEAYEIMASAYAGKKDFSMSEQTLHDTLDKFPNSNSTKIVLAKIYMANDKPERAERILHDVLEAESDNENALHLLANIKKRKKDTQAVIDLYSRILDINSDDMNARFELGIAYLVDKKSDKAKKIAAYLNKNYKNRPEGPYLTGLIHYSNHEIDEAIVSLKEALKMAHIPQASYYLGLALLSKGNLEQATNEFQRTIDMDPEMIQARLLLSMTHLKKGRPDDAEKEVLHALKIDENNALAHNILGSVYLAQAKGDLAIREFDRAIELDPALVDAYVKKGVFNLLSGDSRKAEEDFTDAVEIAPDILATRIILARYYIKEKKFDDAIKILNEGLKENPNDAILYNIMGAAYLGSEDFDNADRYFNKAIAANPGFVLPYFNLAFIHLKANQKDEAIAAYRKVLKIDENNVRALLMLAKIMEEDKRDEDALSYYKKATKQNQPVAYVSLAGYYQRRKDGKRALEALEDALRIDPRNITVLDMMGRIYFAAHDYEKVISVYRRMASVSPIAGTQRIAAAYSAMGKYDRALQELQGVSFDGVDRIKVIMQRVKILMKKEDYYAAERAAQEIISLAPESDAGYIVLADVYARTRKFSEAVDALNAAEKINPENVKTRITKGNVYVQMEDYQSALKVFKALEKRYPEYAPVYFFQASTMQMMGETKAAVKSYEKALEISPDYAPSLNNLAYLYAEGSGDIEKAFDMAQRAKKIAPKDGNITDTLGWTLFKKGNYDEALKYFLEASTYLPEEPSIHYHLGLVYHEKGLDDPAREQLEKAIFLGEKSHFPYIEETRGLLEGIRKGKK